jgi:chemotaxis protein methyltransferase CheR
MSADGPSDLERFAAWIARTLGLRFDDRPVDLAAALARRAKGSARSYVRRLDGLQGADVQTEVRALAAALTIGETYFFRSPSALQAFIEVAVPQRVHVEPDRPLSILCLGCATGEEPYTLAMLLADAAVAGGPRGWHGARIVGVDVNPAALAHARAGVYSGWALRQTPAADVGRWFRRVAGAFHLDEELKRRVVFEERNVAASDPALWPPRAYDIVFCRNVTMYFTPSATSALVGRIAASLRPDGFLFLGEAETLRGVSDDFELCQTHDAFYYRLRSAPPARALVASPDARLIGEGAPPAEDVSWHEAIARSSERVATLTMSRAESRPAPRPSPDASGRLDAALELVRRERYREASAALTEAPDPGSLGGDVDLLRAVLWTNAGEHERAEAACADLLAKDERHAGARYLMALCREHRGDIDGAIAHDLAATHLDPSFAMPAMHLGMLRRRRGEDQAAREALDRALALLPHEDGERLLLFGGGFTRASLTDLCRAELTACRGGRR